MHQGDDSVTPHNSVYSTLYKTIQTFENIVEKEENGGNQHFLLFQQSFLPFGKNKHISISK